MVELASFTHWSKEKFLSVLCVSAVLYSVLGCSSSDSMIDSGIDATSIDAQPATDAISPFNSKLESLEIWPYVEVAPAFSSDVDTYNVTTSPLADLFALTATPAHPEAVLEWNNLLVPAGGEFIVGFRLETGGWFFDVSPPGGGERRYLFFLGRGLPLMPVYYMKADAPEPADGFGHRVAVQQHFVAVGVPGDDGEAGERPNVGSIQTFVRVGKTFVNSNRLYPPKGENDTDFGRSFALWRNENLVGSMMYLAVGAPLRSSNGLVNNGAVFIYQTDPNNIDSGWTMTNIIEGEHELAEFGHSIDLWDRTLIIGAPRETVGSVQTGAVHAYRRVVVDLWSYEGRLDCSDAVAGDECGASVAVWENAVVVGAPGSDAEGEEDSGRAYPFERQESDASWLPLPRLSPPRVVEGDRFGSVVDIYDRELVVSAPFEDNNATNVDDELVDLRAFDSGAVHMFQRDSNDIWQYRSYFKASNTGIDDQFGYDMRLHKDWLIVGAPFESSDAVGVNGFDNNVLPNSGAAYTYRAADNEQGERVWSFDSYLKATNPDSDDRFGTSIGIEDGYIWIGAPGESSSVPGVNFEPLNDDNRSSGSGAGYVYH